MKDKTVRIPLHELVEDFKLLPRPQVDMQNVGSIRRAIVAGVEMPPIIIDGKSKRIIDGFSRKRAYETLYGLAYATAAIARTYPNEAAMFAEAMALNTVHGRNLSSYDRTFAAVRAKQLFHMSYTRIAAALHMTEDDLKAMCNRKTCTAHIERDGSVEATPIKLTISHMQQRLLRPDQVEANIHLSGQRPLRSINELIILLETDLWDINNSLLMERGRVFCELFRRLDAQTSQAVGHEATS